MPEVSVDISVYCSCGEGLCGQSTSGSGRYGPSVTVEPCEKCQAIKYDEGYKDGYEAAQKDFDVE